MPPRCLTALTLTALLQGGLTALPLTEHLSPPATAQTDPKAEADRLFQQGIAQFKRSHLREALRSWQQSLKLYRQLGDQLGEGGSLDALGLAYHSLGDYGKAIEFHQQSLAIARKIGSQQGEAVSLGNLGAIYHSLGDYDKAIEFHQQSLAIARKIGNQRGEAASLDALGLAYRNLGDYGKAIEFHQQSLAIARKIDDQREEAVSLDGLGLVYHSLGDYGEAIEFHQQSLAIARKIGNQRGEAVSLGNLGLVYHSLGDYGEAIEFHQQSLAIARKIGDQQGEAASLGNLGLVYHILGDYSKAIEFHQQSLAIARKIGDQQGEAASLGNLGIAYSSQGDYDKAIDFHQQFLAIARKIGDQQGEAISLGNLGNTYDALRDYRKAIDFLQQSIAIARKIGDQRVAAISLNNLGIAFLRNQELSQANRALYQSIQLKEALWQELGPNHTHKLSLFEKGSNTYRNLQRVLVLQNQPQLALEVAERGRTRTLAEQMARPLQRQSLQPPTLEDIQRLAVAHNATLVEYSSLPNYDMLLVWVIPPNGPIRFKAIDLDAADGSLADLAKLTRRTTEKLRGNSSLTTLVRSSRQTIESEGSAAAPTSDPLQTLHQLLIQPIADLLPPPESHIIFIPHQELFLVPFAALKDQQDTYLIEQYAISTAPSLQALILAEQHRQRVQGKTEMVLVVGNPALPKQLPEEKPLELLPGAEAEASIVANHFNTQPLLGTAATETTVVKQLHQARIIHLATHGLALDPPNWFDLSGRIALAPSATDDGWLTATELVELTRDNPLNAEMVVLSACDTGLGRVTGDGVLGLSRALIVSGVPSFVVSLWQVPDDSAQFLMERFYKELKNSDNRAQALRKAMLQTLEVHEGPADWAAFTLVGTAQ